MIPSDSLIIKKKIITLLTKYNFDNTAVYQHYDECVNEKLIDWSLNSFKRYVRKISNRTQNQNKVNGLENTEYIEDQLYNSVSKKEKPPQTQNQKLSEVLNKLKTENINVNAFINTQSRNIYLEKIINEQRIELNKFKLDTHRTNIIIDQFKDEIKNFKPDVFKLNVNVIKNKGTNKNVLLLSDIHYGENVNPIEINGINEYSRRIAKDRLTKLFEKNLKFATFNGCSECHIMMMGDMFSGIIHDELRETSDEPITRLILELYSFIVSLVNEYKNHFDKIVINCVCGNHGRITEKVTFKRKAQNNFEYIFYKFLEAYYETSDKVKINVSESPTLLCNVGNIKWKISHGDSYKSSGNFLNLPAMAVSRDSIKENSILRDAGYDYDVMSIGHFHVPSIIYSILNSPIIFNSSVIGGNEYSIHRLHSAFPPSQYAFVCDNEIIVTRLIFL